MNIKELTQTLNSLGWITSKDEVGDRNAVYALADRKADIIYRLYKYRGEQKLGAMLSLATDDFSNSCEFIDPGYGKNAPFICAWKGLDICAPEILEKHVRHASEQAIVWAKEQDLNKALIEHAALPTNAPGARPIWHLASLAIMGNIDRLKSYQSSLEAGDRLGFVPYITKDYIDRAVALAERRIAQS